MNRRISRSGFLGVMAAVLSGAQALAAGPRRLMAMRMEGVSMLPTLRNGERIVIDTNAYRHTAPRRGEIVAFRSPAYPARVPALIKRVVGLPGETVRVHDGRVWINGHVLKEPYVHNPAWYRYGPHRIAAGSYFLLGDNRNNSEDSHLLGPVPRREIIGKVVRRG